MAHGTERFLPEAHFSLHLPKQLDRHHCLLSCFVHERRHKEVKRWANELQTGSLGAEKSILREVCLTHWSDLQSFEADSLQAWKPASNELQQAFIQFFDLPLLLEELQMSIWSVRCKRGDMCLAEVDSGECIVEIWFHLKYGDEKWSMVRQCFPTSKVNTFRLGEGAAFIETNSIRGACIHKPDGNDEIVIAPETFWPKA